MKRLGGRKCATRRDRLRSESPTWDMQPAVRTEQDRLHNCVGSDVGAYELPRRRTMYLTPASPNERSRAIADPYLKLTLRRSYIARKRVIYCEQNEE